MAQRSTVAVAAVLAAFSLASCSGTDDGLSAAATPTITVAVAEAPTSNADAAVRPVATATPGPAATATPATAVAASTATTTPAPDPLPDEFTGATGSLVRRATTTELNEQTAFDTLFSVDGSWVSAGYAQNTDGEMEAYLHLSLDGENWGSVQVNPDDLDFSVNYRYIQAGPWLLASQRTPNVGAGLLGTVDLADWQVLRASVPEDRRDENWALYSLVFPAPQMAVLGNNVLDTTTNLEALVQLQNDGTIEQIEVPPFTPDTIIGTPQRPVAIGSIDIGPTEAAVWDGAAWQPSSYLSPSTLLPHAANGFTYNVVTDDGMVTLLVSTDDGQSWAEGGTWPRTGQQGLIDEFAVGPDGAVALSIRAERYVILHSTDGITFTEVDMVRPANDITGLDGLAIGPDGRLGMVLDRTIIFYDVG